MSRGPKKCEYIVNQAYFDIESNFFKDIPEILIPKGEAFEVKKGYELRKFHDELNKYCDDYIQKNHDLVRCHFNCWSSDDQIQVIVYDPDLYLEFKKIYETKVLKKDEDSKMIKTNYTLDELGSKFKYSISIEAPINNSITYNLIDIVKSKYSIYKNSNLSLFKVVKAIYSDGKEETLGFYLSDNNNMGFPLYSGGYEFILNNGKLTVESDQVSSTLPHIKEFICSFELTERTNENIIEEKKTSGNLESNGPWHEPEKVKAIRETIETVMKNTGKTDLKDIDLDMLSSCINATFNREKMFYKWLNEFTNEEVDDNTIKFAFKFLDWVLLNKIDSEKTNSIYFKE